MLSRWWIRLIIAIGVGVLYPLVHLWVVCRTPDSEACVWAKAYLPLSFALSLPLFGGATFLVLTVVAKVMGGRPVDEKRAGSTRD